MNRFERTRVLVEGEPALAQSIAADIEKQCQVEILSDPKEELICLKTRETALNSLFLLGEALISSCRVRIEDTVGHGFILGSRRNDAYCLAVIDAAFSSGRSFKRQAKWEKQIEKEATRLRDKHAKERARIERTRVSFQSMDGSA